MRLFKKILRLAATLFLLALLALLIALRYPVQDPVLPPSPFAARPVMKQLPPLGFQVFETGFSEAPRAYAVRNAPLFATQRMTHSAVVITHPKGRVVLDSGFGTNFFPELAKVPLAQRLFAKFFFKPTTPLVKNPAFPALDPQRDFFLISHSHWDHLGGTLDFPQIPIKMLQAERDFALDAGVSEAHGVFPQHIQAIRDRLQALELKDVPYENFPKSLDLFGDGSLVLVSLAGHTPGSLGLFANLPGGERLLFVGDALWSTDAKGQPEARSPVAEWTSDLDKVQARAIRLRLAELIAHSNEVTLVPIHDSRALAKVQALGKK